MRKDHTSFWAAATVTALKDKAGNLRGFAKLTHDITEQKRTEESLRASEEKYRTLFANMTEGFMLGEPILDSAGNAVDHRLLASNQALYVQTGLTGSIEGRCMRDVFSQVEQHWIDRYAAVALTGQPQQFTDYNGSTRRHYEVNAFSPSPGQWAILGRDITEKKQVEDELRTFKFFSDHSSESNVVVDSQGRIRYANRRLCERLGYSEEEIIRLNFQDIAPKFNTEMFWELAKRTKEGSVPPFESSRRRKDGTIYPVEVSATALEVKGEWLIFVVSRDITERKRAEQAIKESERRLAMALEASASAVWEMEVAAGTVHGDNLLFTGLGYAPGELTTRVEWRALIHQDDQEAAYEKLEDVIQGKSERCRVELRVRAKDGSWRWMLSQVMAAERDAQGRAIRLVGTHTDITEHKQAEQEIRAGEIRFHSTFEQLAVGLAHVSLEGLLLRVNAKFAAIVGYDRQTLEHMSFQELTHPDDLQKDLDNVAGLLAGRIAGYTMEKRYIRKDSTVIWCNLTVSLVRTATGEPDYFVGVVEDTQARKEAEQALKESEERFRLLYENAPLGIVLFDKNGVMTTANHELAEMTGYSPEEFSGMPVNQTMLPEENAVASGLFKKLLAGESATNKLERRWVCKDGSAIWIRLTSTMMRDQLDQPQWGLAIIENIAERKQTEEALRQSEEKFRATFEHAPLGIAECNVDGTVIEANAKLADILGYTKDELAHLTPSDLNHPGDMEETLSNLRKLAAGETDFYTMEERYLRKDRSLVWVNTTASLVHIHEKPYYLVLTVEDITKRKKTEEDLKRAMERSYHQANHDMLTGLANRAAFKDRLSDALAYAKRDGHLVALHLLDLDGFKSINDTLGHHIGDLLLQDVAKRIKSNVRASDLVARLGGDEFVVIQTHLAEPAAAAVLASKLVEELGRKYVLEHQEVHSGTSLGIALYPNDAQEPAALIKQADLALYDAKNRGRFNYQFYRKELGAAFHEAQRVEQELVRALRENEFCLHYQPQFDLKSGRITGIEALLRWHHPTRGTLAAATFIQTAERARLMPTIGEWTLEAACRQYKEWSDFGLSVPLTLNLSSMQLRDPRFLQTVNRILEETKLPPPLLQLEMRESVLLDPKVSTSILAQLKDRGLRLALDEFGTELTALSTLGRFPLDAVKPGHGLVKELPSQGREATSVLAAIIGVAHNLKIAVCADGVENANQLTAVKEQGCDSAQGYLLSSPVDADDMKRLIEAELAHG